MFTLQVYSPYQRNWLSVLNNNIPHYLEDCPKPHANPESIYKTKQFASLFETPVPIYVPKFELDDDDRKKMQEVWPAGEDVAEKVSSKFMLYHLVRLPLSQDFATVLVHEITV
jgi:deoxyribodipyrimidine photo-lyase